MSQEKRWEILAHSNKEAATKMAVELKVPLIIADLLVQRGVTDYDQARLFFKPLLSDMHDPFLMKDMEKAVDRLNRAFEEEERILIYGDYDVDGTTSVALFYNFFDPGYHNLGFYIPERETEGYGVSTQGIDYAEDNGFSLIISLDCGIKAVDKVKYAKEKGIDFIICDHHTPDKELPKAVAVLNPKVPGCPYPYKELSGCGVGFKFIQAFCIKNKLPESEYIKLLDLVAVSIAADIVPVTGENRCLAYHGLKKLSKNPSPGLRHMIKLAGMEKQELSISDVVFKIAPRINAAGRLDKADKSLELLIAGEDDDLVSLGVSINQYNDERKDLDKYITEEGLSIINASDELRSSYSTVLYRPRWHKGVLGIVASRLIESYYRPTLVLTESNGLAAGSGRSIPDFNLYDALYECRDLLISFGGHKYAAGLTLKPELVPELQKRLEAIARREIRPEMLKPVQVIDAEIELSEINSKFFRLLQRFAPFGPGNMTPIFASYGLNAKDKAKAVGNDNSHLKLTVKDKNGNRFPAIAFGFGHMADLINNGSDFDIAYSVDLNEFRGMKNLQLRIRDIVLR